MHRNVTALYRSHATVELVRRELSEMGIAQGDIRVIPDADVALEPDASAGSAPVDALRNLDLPDNDLRGYEGRIRQGDVVVSVAVAEERVPHVEEIMRRPEDMAQFHESRGAEFDRLDASLDAARDPEAAAGDVGDGPRVVDPARVPRDIP